MTATTDPQAWAPSAAEPEADPTTSAVDLRLGQLAVVVVWGALAAAAWAPFAWSVWSHMSASPGEVGPWWPAAIGLGGTLASAGCAAGAHAWWRGAGPWWGSLTGALVAAVGWGCVGVGVCAAWVNQPLVQAGLVGGHGDAAIPALLGAALSRLAAVCVLGGLAVLGASGGVGAVAAAAFRRRAVAPARSPVVVWPAVLLNVVIWNAVVSDAALAVLAEAVMEKAPEAGGGWIPGAFTASFALVGGGATGVFTSTVVRALRHPGSRRLAVGLGAVLALGVASLVTATWTGVVEFDARWVVVGAACAVAAGTGDLHGASAGPLARPTLRAVAVELLWMPALVAAATVALGTFAVGLAAAGHIVPYIGAVSGGPLAEPPADGFLYILPYYSVAFLGMALTTVAQTAVLAVPLLALDGAWRAARRWVLRSPS